MTAALWVAQNMAVPFEGGNQKCNADHNKLGIRSVVFSLVCGSWNNYEMLSQRKKSCTTVNIHEVAGLCSPLFDLENTKRFKCCAHYNKRLCRTKSKTKSGSIFYA